MASSSSSRPGGPRAPQPGPASDPAAGHPGGNPPVEDPDPTDLPEPIPLRIAAESGGQRLDKALALAAADRAEIAPGLTRSRLANAIAAGQVCDPDGRTVSEARRKVKPGEIFILHLPPPVPATPLPEEIPLTIAHEDAHLIVVDKPAGLVMHPAAGAETGTLVNALLYHCGPSLAGIGGERRPGIVHRIDKDTSGLVVAAKTEAAMAGLAALFAAHDIERTYTAIAWGIPSLGNPRLAGLPAVAATPEGGLRIEAAIHRHRTDRKRMAVVRKGGRHAITHLQVEETLEGPACRLTCRLQTGRTHQIRVHARHIGHPLIGDPVYGRGRTPPPDAPAALTDFPRQALHAAKLGFRHPITGEAMAFESPLPPDMAALLADLRRKRPGER